MKQTATSPLSAIPGATWRAARRVCRSLPAVEEIVFPARCVLCGSHLAWTAGRQVPICEHCPPAIAIDGEDGSRCTVCSRPLISEMEVCTRCRDRDFQFERNVSVFRYSGPAKELMKAYKFEGRRELSCFFAECLAPVLRAFPAASMLVPVPPRPGAGRERGYVPVDLLVRRLSEVSGVPVRRLLARSRGASQKTLSYTSRLTNLRGRITLRRRAGQLPSSVVLVDDVFTTGATANECTRVLKEAGVGKVYVLTVAID